MIKKIIAFGDSWTQGEGWIDKNIEKDIVEKEYSHLKNKFDQYDNPSGLMMVRHSNSWVRWLSDEYNAEYENHGISGSSNKNILDRAWQRLVKSDVIEEKPLIIIMWSSIIRDQLDIFPKSWEKNFLGWSYDVFLSNPEKYIDAAKTYSLPPGDSRLKEFEIKYREKYILDIFEESFLEHANVNYVNLIYEYCKHFDIPLVMCNAFETIIKDRPQYKKYKFNNYFLQDSTIHNQLLKEKNYKELFEQPQLSNDGYTNGQHPNINGYKKISQYLKGFIEENGKYIFVQSN